MKAVIGTGRILVCMKKTALILVKKQSTGKKLICGLVLSKETVCVIPTHIKKQLQFTCTNVTWQIYIQYWGCSVLCMCFST